MSTSVYIGGEEQTGNLPAPPRLTLWMTPAAWIYCEREGVRPSAQRAPQASQLYPAQPGSSVRLPTATSTYLQPLQHLIHKKLDSVFTQSLMLHQLAQISAHERHHQVAVETRDAANAGLVPRPKLTPTGPSSHLATPHPSRSHYSITLWHPFLTIFGVLPYCDASIPPCPARLLLSVHTYLGQLHHLDACSYPHFPKWQAGFRGTLFLRKGLTLQSFLARNSLCRPG